jgi:hypothetical protein
MQVCVYVYVLLDAAVYNQMGCNVLITDAMILFSFLESFTWN